MKTILALIAILAAAWLAGAWALMLEVGVAHRDWWPALPAMSYHVAVVIVAIGIVFAIFTSIANVIVKEMK